MTGNTKKFVAKNGLETQNIKFASPGGNNFIHVEMLDSDTLSFYGNAGQLFSITDSLTGTIFGINDISGFPSFEIDSDGAIRLAEYSGNVAIGLAVPDGKFHVADGSAGTVTANSIADTIVAESSGNGGMSVLTPSANTGYFAIGSPADAVGAYFSFNNSGTTGRLATSLAGSQLILASSNDVAALTIDSTQNATFAGNISLGDSQNLYIGTSNDLTLTHNGTDSFINSATGALYLQSNSGSINIRKQTGGENMATFTPDGAVNLYYDNSLKLSTISTGVNVDGEVVTDAFDSGNILYSRNASAADAEQFYIRHNSGNTEFGNLRGDIILSDGNLYASNAAGPGFLDEAATNTNPTLVPNKTDLDTGIGWASADVGALVANGSSGIRWNSSTLYGENAGGPAFHNSAASSTNPTLRPDRTDTDSGIGLQAANNVSIVAGGVESIRFGTTGFTFDGVSVTGIQTSGEGFTDSDSILMTAAAVDDRIAAVGGTASNVDITSANTTNSTHYVTFVTGSASQPVYIDSSLTYNPSSNTLDLSTISFDSDLTATDAAGPTILNEAASSTNPTLLPNRADGDTGIGWVSTDQLGMVAGGLSIMGISTAGISVNGTSSLFGDVTVTGNIAVADGNGAIIVNEAATSGNPTLVPNKTDLDTGIGWAVANELSMVAGGNEIMRFRGGASIIARQSLVTNTSGSGAMINQAASSTAPTFAPNQSDTDTGIGWNAADSAALIAGGANAFNWNSGAFYSDNASGPYLENAAATSANPTLIPNRSDLDTGIGWNTTNVLSFVAGGAERAFVRSDGVFASNGAGAGLLNETATTTNPTLVANRADADTGIGWSSDRVIFVCGGVNVGRAAPTRIRVANAAGPAMQNEAASATNPTLLPNYTDADTGIGWQAANNVSIVAGGVELARAGTELLTVNGTGAILFPSGNNAQRPTASNGMIRYSTESNSFEGYADGAWGAIAGGSSVKMTANGSITSGATVSQNADGSVTQIVDTGSAKAAGTPVTFETGAMTVFKKQAVYYDPDEDRSVLAYIDPDDSNLYVVAGQVDSANNSISYGTPELVVAAAPGGFATCYDTTANKGIVVYTEATQLTYRVITLTGSSISLGTAGAVTTNNPQTNSDVACCFINEAICIFFVDTDSSFHYLKCISGEISGTTLGSISGLTIVDSTTDTTRKIVTKRTGIGTGVSEIGLMMWTENTGAREVLQARTFTYNGSTMSLAGSWGVNLDSGNWTQEGNVTDFDFDYLVDENRLLVAWSQNSHTNKGVFMDMFYDSFTSNRFEDFDGNNAGTSGSYGEFQTSGADYISVCANPSAGTIGIFSSNVTSKGTMQSVSYSQLRPERAAELEFEAGNISGLGVCYDSTSEKYVVHYIDDDDTDQGKTVIISESNPSTNAADYLGIATEAISDAGTGSIALPGSVDSNQSGLTAGTDYWVDADGSLSNVNTGFSFVGTALSSTEILLKEKKPSVRVTLTAGGTIPARVPVAINPLGQAIRAYSDVRQEPTGTPVPALNVVTSSGFDVTATATSDPNVAKFIEIPSFTDEKIFLAAWAGGGANQVYLEVYRYNGFNTAPTRLSNMTISSTTTPMIDAVWCDDIGRIAVMYKDSASNLRLQLYSISATDYTLTATATLTTLTANVSLEGGCPAKMWYNQAEGKIVYTYGNTSSQNYIGQSDVTASTITLRSASFVNTQDVSYQGWGSEYHPDQDVYVVIYTDASDDVYARAYQINGTTWTAGTAVVLGANAAYIEYQGHVFWDSVQSEMFAIFYSQSTGEYPIRQIEVSGTTITATTFRNGANYGASNSRPVFDPDLNLLLMMADAGSSSRFFDMDNPQLTGTINLSGPNSAQNYKFRGYDKIFGVYPMWGLDGASDNEMFFVTFYGTTHNHLSVIGLSENAASRGEEVSVILSGELDGFTDLDIGSVYYVGADSSITSTATGLFKKLGTAVSTTKLIVSVEAE